MTWPLALLCIISIVSTLIYVACTEWLWKAGGGYPATEEPKPLPKVDDGYVPGGYIRPIPTRPSPARKSSWNW